MLYKKITGYALLVVLFAGCGKHQAKRELPQGEKPRLYLVNVLDKASFDDAHIPGSRTVDFMKIKMAAQDWDRSIPFITYCSNYLCSASKDAAKTFVEMGFAQVMAYEGGMAEWYQLSQTDPTFKVDGPAQAEYLKQKVAPLAPYRGQLKIISAQELQKMISPVTL